MKGNKPTDASFKLRYNSMLRSSSPKQAKQDYLSYSISLCMHTFHHNRTPPFLSFSFYWPSTTSYTHNTTYPITFPSEQEQRPMLPLAPNYHFQWHNPRSRRVCHHRCQIVSLVVTPKNCCSCRYKMPLDCNCEIRDETFVTTLRNDR